MGIIVLIVEQLLKCKNCCFMFPEKYKQNDTTPRCPHCHSSNIQKIGGLERAGSVAMLGVFSKKINKSFKCKSCGYTW